MFQKSTTLVKKYGAALIILSFFAGCKPSTNGKYLIYSTVEVNGNDTITTYLKNSLQGKQFDIYLADKYLSLTELNTKRKLILARDTRIKDLYTLAYKKGDASYIIKLTGDTAFKMQVDLTFSPNKVIVLPAQFGGEFAKNKKYGIVDCYLSKVDE